ncbi:MAG: DUF2080 family transposase-associated protein [Clostridium sp.]|nr:DUF2080 family transposase-associated protein [Clostridium sp.]
MGTSGSVTVPKRWVSREVCISGG